eukprot:CAMPEP_0168375196 /NCGR_PEP_ID=MMETSP0228-20121227/9687_1 /TAXON_ID=133427 /ORGANISM="Protoceratium reticulatum, Strain CCCM 535 (=CCMP 1889)" /LENGTH=45 /DNA_ID= /DNA_START= /DNA_END= /DNA_ORIENTATION=
MALVTGNGQQAVGAADDKVVSTMFALLSCLESGCGACLLSTRGLE